MRKNILLACLMPSLAFAIDVGDVSNFIFTDQDSLTKEIINTVDSARLVTLQVKRINSPKEGGGFIDFETPNEILSTPAGVLLPSRARENFRIFYQGPKDDKERYYKLIWQDLPIQKQETAAHDQSLAMASAAAQIGTILVVAPRTENFKYLVKDNTVTNQGNVTFRLVAYGPCPAELKSDQEICQEQYNVMPNNAIKLKYTDLNQKKSYAGIWHKEQFLPLKNEK